MPQRKNKNWKESEIKFLKENYKKMKVNKLAEKIDRTPRGVRAKLERLNLNLKPLKRNKKYKWTEKDINFLKNNYNDLTDKEMAKHIGKSKSAVCRKRLKLGYRKQTGKPYIHSNYYIRTENGKRVWIHLEVAEEKLGRKLKDKEMVHHIDGDKLNNNPNNLYVCEDRKEHQSIHSQLERIAFQLVRKGFIEFEHQTGKYYIKSTRTEG